MTDTATIAMYGDSKPRGRGRPRGSLNHRKLRLFSRNDLDKRSPAYVKFDQIVGETITDLGGNVTATQRHLIERFASALILGEHLDLRMLLGNEVNVEDQAKISSTLVRLAEKIGINPQIKSGRAKGGKLTDLIRQEREAAAT